MASQSLYRKWRSQTFSELVGQEAVVRTLKNALKAGKLTHAYLFTGPRGTGKTSTARLLAKTVNCLSPVNGEPCNECQLCREIADGSSFNVVEIDAASNRGIDSIRELREKVMVPPSSGRYKVYILDEAHMLTTEAFNALLKTLEEPPPHAIFVMATTDVHKMLPTVLSRCQRYDFKRITTRQIVEHLCFVAEQEKVQLERGAAELLARAASGGMRDALSLLDQAIAYSGESITLDQVQAMLGVADPRAIQKFIQYVAQLDSSAALHQVHELVEAGADLRQINGQIAELWRAMMLCKAGANIAEIMDSTEDEIRDIQAAVQQFTLEELMECSRIFAQNDLIQKNQGTPQLGIELALLACIELHRRAQAGEALVPQPASRPVAPQASQPALRPAAPQPSQPAPRPVTPPDLSQPSQPVERKQASIRAATGINIPPPIQPEPPAPEEPPVQQEETPPVAEESAEPLITLDEVKEKWELVIRRVRSQPQRDGARVSAFLRYFTLLGIEPTADVPLLVIKATQTFFYTNLKDKDKQLIEWALEIELPQKCRLRVLPPDQDWRPGNRSRNSIPQPERPAPQPPTQQQNGSSGRNGPIDLAEALAVFQATPTAVQPPPVQEPLARNGSVRENSTQESTNGTNALKSAALTSTEERRQPVSQPPTAAPSETRREQVERKAKEDPVVREVVRIFKAEIKDIYLK